MTFVAIMIPMHGWMVRAYRQIRTREYGVWVALAERLHEGTLYMTNQAGKTERDALDRMRAKLAGYAPWTRNRGAA